VSGDIGDKGEKDGREEGPRRTFPSGVESGKGRVRCKEGRGDRKEKGAETEKSKLRE